MQRSALAMLFVVCALAPVRLGAYTPETMARAIRALMPNVPVMVEVARCESGLRQYDSAGHVLRGGLGGMMLGLFQFHEKYHRAAALSLGYNLDTLLGNIAYARTLYTAQGLTPWESSRHCWEVKKNETGKLGNKEINEQPLTKTLRYGMTDPLVRVLQRSLNARGYQASTEGAETTYFGVATYKALSAFQCDTGMACLKDPARARGAGVVDERTWRALTQGVENQ